MSTITHAAFSTQEGFLPQKRNIKKVPFVELFQGRLQGVVSSGSDIERVYVAFFEAGTHDYYCSTNNNRPCGGLRGSLCKHLQELLGAAIAQYGPEQVIQFLQIPDELSELVYDGDWLLLEYIQGSEKKEPANEVFSRFLNYLRYLELQPSQKPLPEMAWFV